MIARGVIALAVLLAACSGTARGLEAYRADTQKLLETRNDQLTRCYDEALKNDAKASGTVTVRFVVEKKTGAIAQATIDSAKTTAPEPVTGCVLKAVNGLKLEPPDRHEGQATFVYELKAAAPPAS